MKVIGIEGTTEISVNGETELQLTLLVEIDGKSMLYSIGKGDIIFFKGVYLYTDEITGDIMSFESVYLYVDEITEKHITLIPCNMGLCPEDKNEAEFEFPFFIGKVIQIYQQYFE